MKLLLIAVLWFYVPKVLPPKPVRPAHKYVMPTKPPIFDEKDFDIKRQLLVI